MVKTAIAPLSKMKKAVVLLDSDDPQIEQTLKAIDKFFTPKGIEVKKYVFCFKEKKELTGCIPVYSYNRGIFGTIISRSKRVDRNVDMFISLLSPDIWLSRYEASCSKAEFKIGRAQIKKDIYDFVLTGSEGKSLNAVFLAIADILEKVN